MYVNSEGFWVCGNKLEDSNSVYMKSTVSKGTMPSMPWMYLGKGGAWMEDSGLILLPQIGEFF